jgi:putative MFS transporter
MTDASPSISVRSLDRARVSPFHRRLLVLAGIGWLFDAMDLLIVGSVIAAVARVWQLAPQVRGAIITANLLGMFVGAALSGYLADRYGRKLIFGATLLSYSLLTGLSALAWNAVSLATIRFFAGLGLGGELPVASTLVTEFAPAAERGRMIVLLESFWAYGSILAALIGYLAIPRLGWQAAFAVGALPALYVVVLRRTVPESPRYLLARGDARGADAIVRQMLGGGPSDPAGASAADRGRGGAVRIGELFASRTLRRRTFTLWVLWIAMVLSYYGIFTWLPSLLVDKGFALQQAFLLNLLISIFQIPGYFSAAWFVERIGRKATLVLYLVGCAIGAFFFAQQTLGATPDVAATLGWGAVIAFFNLGAWGIAYAYTPELYPTRLRATGAGFAAAAGRLVGAFGPYLVGAMLASFGGSQFSVFLAFTAILLLGGIVVGLFGEETRGLPLEEISAEVSPAA